MPRYCDRNAPVPRALGHFVTFFELALKLTKDTQNAINDIDIYKPKKCLF